MPFHIAKKQNSNKPKTEIKLITNTLFFIAILPVSPAGDIFLLLILIRLFTCMILSGFRAWIFRF